MNSRLTCAKIELNAAEDICRNMKARRHSAETENIWARVLCELKTPAKIYGFPLLRAKTFSPRIKFNFHASRSNLFDNAAYYKLKICL